MRHSDDIMESRDDLKQRLSPEQFRVACDCGTEPPFDNEYWDNKEPGIYVDVISGEPLFSSKAKPMRPTPIAPTMIVVTVP